MIKVDDVPALIGVNSVTNFIYVTHEGTDRITVLLDEGEMPKPPIITVDPVTSGKSILMNKATVMVFDQDGAPLVGEKT